MSLLGYGLYRAVEAHTATRFEHWVDTHLNLLSWRLNSYVTVLNGLAGLWSAHGGAPSEEQITSYLEIVGVHSKFRGFRSVGFVHGGRLHALQRYASPPHDVKVYDQETLDDPMHQEAMHRARDTGYPAASGRLVFHDEAPERSTSTFTLYVPVYSAGTKLTTADERRSRLQGFVLGELTTGELLQGISTERSYLLRMELYDGISISSDNSLIPAGDPDAQDVLSAERRHITFLNVGGHPWTVALWHPSDVSFASSGFMVRVVIAGGILVSFVLFALARYQARARYTAEDAAEGMRWAMENKDAIITSALEGILSVNAQGTITDINPAGAEIFSVRREEAIARPLLSFFSTTASENEDWRGILLCGKPLGSSLELEGSREGETFPLELCLLSNPSQSGTEQYLAFVRDLTEQKRTESFLRTLVESERYARTEAEHLSTMKDQFLATLSHELRTPLNAILGWAQVLQRNSSPEDIREGLQIIERSARHQARMVEDLLDVSRIVSGKLRFEIEEVAFGDVAKKVIESTRSEALAKGIQLTYDIDEQAAPVNADPHRLHQVVCNLLSNAIKFTKPGGQVHVSLGMHNHEIELEVRDNGAGIEKSFLPHVFERFRQADSSTTRSYGGLGLGLSIVKYIVERHGGTIAAESEGRAIAPNVTQRFRVRLSFEVLPRYGLVRNWIAERGEPWRSA